jgi:hypothetical protein
MIIDNNNTNERMNECAYLQQRVIAIISLNDEYETRQCVRARAAAKGVFLGCCFWTHTE